MPGKQINDWQLQSLVGALEAAASNDIRDFEWGSEGTSYQVHWDDSAEEHYIILAD